jgi:hypothetical protein
VGGEGGHGLPAPKAAVGGETSSSSPLMV